jgi:hypothetical protein
MTTTTSPAVVRRFAHALLSLDENVLAETSAYDLTWTIPGHGLVSGIHLGVPAVLAVATTIRRHGIYLKRSSGGGAGVAPASRTRLRTALLRRPRFDEAGALQAARLDHCIARPYSRCST